MAHDTISPDLRAFLSNRGFIQTLQEAWSKKDAIYIDRDDGKAIPLGILHYLQTYHTYQALLGDQSLPHAERAESLLLTIARSVQPNGFLKDSDGTLIGHPALAGQIADSLGTGAFYGAKLGYSTEARDRAKIAILLIEENHPCYRQPEGTQGRTQQMRFELLCHYWAWRLTDDPKYRNKFVTLWTNGMDGYTNLKAESAVLLEPSLHPDYTWNYACGTGRTSDYSTNTHTPTYYNTEPQGFAFAYAHGLKDGALAPNPEWSEFTRKFLLGTWRNLARAGHTVTDLDGYGIHRSWFSGCLLETAPYEAVGAADFVGIEPGMKSWFRWYIDRYIEFIQRQPTYEKTGLPVHLPYDHHITIEKQFRALVGARFYTQLARALYEYKLNEVPVGEPPAHVSYAWWHHWLRVSTSVYETSFVGATSGRKNPIVRSFGDPNLGCIHGGSPLSTLFVGKSLMFATSNDPAGLWHAEIRDVHGAIYQSCVSTFADEIALAVKTSDGRILSRDDFQSYEDPCYALLGEDATEVIWSKNLREQGFRFSVHNAYRAESIQLKWGCQFPAGFFAEAVTLILTVPVKMAPEIRFGMSDWKNLDSINESASWPGALRWSDGAAAVHVELKPSRPGTIGRLKVARIEKNERSPGGENSFCPYELYQLRLEVKMGTTLDSAGLIADLSFSPPGSPREVLRALD